MVALASSAPAASPEKPLETTNFTSNPAVILGQGALARALEPFPVSLRTLDALHLATMDFLRRSEESVELASYDYSLLASAQALGFPLAAL